MSRKNNVNADHYKTAGRGRPWEGVADLRKQRTAQVEAGARRGREAFLPGARARRLAEIRRQQRLRRQAKLKGLTARQLSERRMRLRQAGQG